jgi:hypothetical protein
MSRQITIFSVLKGREAGQVITKESRELKETEENIEVMENGKMEMLSVAVKED